MPEGESGFLRSHGLRQLSFARIEGHVLFRELVTGNYLRMLGINPVLERALFPEDAAAPGGALW